MKFGIDIPINMKQEAEITEIVEKLQVSNRLCRQTSQQLHTEQHSI